MFSGSELLLVSIEGSSVLYALAEGCKKIVNTERTSRRKIRKTLMFVVNISNWGAFPVQRRNSLLYYHSTMHC